MGIVDKVAKKLAKKTEDLEEPFVNPKKKRKKKAKGKGSWRKKKSMSRKSFESLFAGDWENKANGRYRQNGQFQTAVIQGKKVFKGKGFALQARSWREIYNALQLKRLPK